MPTVSVLLDACVPHWLRHELHMFDVETAHFAGFDQLSNGALLSKITGLFDVLVTLDRNMTYQQKVRGTALAVIVLRPQGQDAATLRALLPALRQQINDCAAGTVVIVGDGS